VPVGFVNAVAINININIILSQVDEITGYTSDAGNRVGRAIDTLLHPGQLHYGSVLVAALTMGLILVLERTALARWAWSWPSHSRPACLGPPPSSGPPPFLARHRSSRATAPREVRSTSRSHGRIRP